MAPPIHRIYPKSYFRRQWGMNVLLDPSLSLVKPRACTVIVDSGSSWHANSLLLSTKPQVGGLLVRRRPSGGLLSWVEGLLSVEAPDGLHKQVR